MCDNDMEWIKTSVIISAEDARPFLVKALGARNAKYAGPATDDDCFKLTLEVYKDTTIDSAILIYRKITFLAIVLLLASTAIE